MSLDFLLMVKVTFFSKSKRKAPPNISAGRYSPHLVVKGDVEYLGVSFIELQSSEFDVETEAIVLPVYEGVSYEKLKVGTYFDIMEGPNVVGEGIVTDIG